MIPTEMLTWKSTRDTTFGDSLATVWRRPNQRLLINTAKELINDQLTMIVDPVFINDILLPVPAKFTIIDALTVQEDDHCLLSSGDVARGKVREGHNVPVLVRFRHSYVFFVLHFHPSLFI